MHGLVLIIICISMHGCYCSSLVNQAGVRHAKLRTSKSNWLILSDSNIALEADLVHTEHWYILRKVERKYYKRFIVVNQSEMKKSVDNAKTVKLRDDHIRYIIKEQIVPPGNTGWQMYPYNILAVSAQESDLPFDIQRRQPYIKGYEFLNEISGSTDNWIWLDLPEKMEKDIDWWHHYQYKILIVPATLIDIVTSPIQFCVLITRLTDH
jgi:hypothetical protein